jgi:glutaminase
MDMPDILLEIEREVRPHFGRGKVASYIPGLKRIPPDKFGMVVRMVDGGEYGVGQFTEPFSIQSISKLPMLMLAMSMMGEEIWRFVGKEPSGSAFNSLVQLEYEKGVPRNPFVNAGALVVLDAVMANTQGKASQVMLDYLRVLSQNFAIDYDRKVAASELRTGHRNAAIANLLRAHGRIRQAPDTLLEAYCLQCSLEMSCLDLARALLPLANSGLSPLLEEAVLTDRQTRRINALMMTCGMYDSVGSFAFRVGLPAKSGVGGGIVAVVPRHCCLAVWSPELDRSGNSLVGTAALELFARMTKLSIL